MATYTINNFVRNSGNGVKLAGVSDLTVSNPSVSGGTSDLPTGSAAGAIIAGDMLYVTSNHKLASLSTPGSSNANAASFVGVAADTYPFIITDGVTAPFPAGTPAKVQYYRSGQFRFHTTAADTYNYGDLVYLGADGQTVQKTSSGTSVGRVASDQRAVGAQLGTAITGAAGQDVVIEITTAF